MAIAGAHLQPLIKRNAKLRGIYPATLLYIWKAALPYEVPYSHGIRHRVAYFADGADRSGKAERIAAAAMLPHQYDDDLHLKRMINIAKSLRAVPSVPVIDVTNVKGGKLIYDAATCCLVHQDYEPMTILVSTKNSFDIQNLPISVTAPLLHGTQKTKIEKVSDLSLIHI